MNLLFVLKTQGMKYMNNQYCFKNEKAELHITAYTDRIFRITYGKMKKDSVIVTAVPEGIPCDYEENDNSYVISTKNSVAYIDKESLGISFYSGGKLLSSVNAPVFEAYSVYKYTGGKSEIKKTVDGVKATAVDGERVFVRNSNHAKMLFNIDDELLFGLGAHEEGFECINGNFVPLYQENMRIAIPYFVSAKGYAYLVDNTSFMTFDCTKENQATLYIDCADSVDCYFIFGDFDTVCKEYRYLTGVTPMLPKSVLGYIQSKCEYKNQQELLDTVKKYREISVPLDMIVQDWQYWNEGCWGDKNFDLKRFPDMTACIDELHNLGSKIMISVWPNLNGDSPDKKELEKKNMLLGDGCVYNAFDEGARKTYWSQAYNGLFKHGIDAWWCDCTEPYEVGWGGETREPLQIRMAKTIDEFKKYIDDSLVNAFSLFHSKGIYENQRAVSDKRVFNMTRSGYSGQHRYAAAVWTGDISATWEVLKKQVHIMQNYIATGEAYWNSDVGGFFNDSKNKWFWKGGYDRGCADEGYRELYTRWLQFALFTPFMRSHGMGTAKEIWQFGSEGGKYYDSIKKTIQLRYSLIPFFYSVNANVTFDGKMPVKPLALAFPGDKKAQTVFDEYIYGDTFLVCPVTEPGIEKMTVYLPQGVWYDYFTDKRYIGGQSIEADITISHIPVFVKAGAIIPSVQVMNYIDEKPDAPYTVRVFTGADGEFMLYDDSGCDYEYEKGEYSRIRITYNNATGKIRTEQTGRDKFAHTLFFELV